MANQFTANTVQSKSTLKAAKDAHKVESEVLYIEALKRVCEGESKAAACRALGILPKNLLKWEQKLSFEEKDAIGEQKVEWTEETITILKRCTAKSLTVYENELNLRIATGATGKNLAEITTSMGTIIDKLRTLQDKSNQNISVTTDGEKEMIANTYERLSVVERVKA